MCLGRLDSHAAAPVDRLVAIVQIVAVSHQVPVTLLPYDGPECRDRRILTAESSSCPAKAHQRHRHLRLEI